MRVMVFGKATEDSEKGVPPTAEAFAAMDRFTEELVKAGVLVAGAGLKNSAQAKRIVFDGPGRTVIDGPFAESPRADRRLFDLGGQGHGRGRGLGEAQPQSRAGPERDRAPAVLEAADLAEFMTPEELSAPRDGERGKLGVA